MHIQLVILNDKVNRNNVVCTKEFIEQVINHRDQYVHLPLFCDVDALRHHGYLSHNLDSRNGEFKTSQIGSFESFSTVEIDGVLYLVGTAKVSKRNRFIVDALERLAKDKKLKFSYEIETTSVVEDDGISYITGDPGNHLIGVTVVTEPAVPEARALMVAENENLEKEDDSVDNEKKTVEEQTAESTVTPEEEKKTDETAACGTGKEKAEAKPEEPAKSESTKEEETAACGTGKEKAETTNTEKPAEEKPADETAACGTGKEKAETTEPAKEGEGTKEQIIELSAQNETLKKENEELKTRLSAVEEELNQRKTAEEDQAKAAKRQELLDKVSQVLTEEEIMMLEDALDDLDENAINAALAEKLIKEQTEKEAKRQTAEKYVSSLRITDSCKAEKTGRSRWISE